MRLLMDTDLWSGDQESCSDSRLPISRCSTSEESLRIEIGGGGGGGAGRGGGGGGGSGGEDVQAVRDCGEEGDLLKVANCLRWRRSSGLLPLEVTLLVAAHWWSPPVSTHSGEDEELTNLVACPFMGGVRRKKDEGSAVRLPEVKENLAVELPAIPLGCLPWWWSFSRLSLNLTSLAIRSIFGSD